MKHNLLMALPMLFTGWLEIGTMVAISLLMVAGQSPSPPTCGIRAPTRWVHMLLRWARILLQKLLSKSGMDPIPRKFNWCCLHDVCDRLPS